MDNILILIGALWAGIPWRGLEISLGMTIVVFCSYTLMGIPTLLLALRADQKEGRKLRQLSLLSLSSMPAMASSKTVYEFVQGLRNDAKRAVYNDILAAMRRLMLDIRKHRGGYPADIDELKVFVRSQLRFHIENSAVHTSLETTKFRDLAEASLDTEIMMEIYVADLKASRAEMLKRTAK